MDTVLATRSTSEAAAAASSIAATTGKSVADILNLHLTEEQVDQRLAGIRAEGNLWTEAAETMRLERERIEAETKAQERAASVETLKAVLLKLELPHPEVLLSSILKGSVPKVATPHRRSPAPRVQARTTQPRSAISASKGHRLSEARSKELNAALVSGVKQGDIKAPVLMKRFGISRATIYKRVTALHLTPPGRWANRRG